MGYIITSLEVQKRNPKRINVYLDERYAFSLASIVAAWLTVGRELEDAEVEKLKADDQYEIASQVAFKYLAYKPRTANELTQRLEKANIPDATIGKLLERFKETGMIDDARFAREWVEQRQKSHPRSARMLSIELRRKGIARSEIDKAMQSMMNEEELAYALALQKGDRFIKLEFPLYRQRMSAYLCRRGFSYEVVKSVVKRLWEENYEDKSME